MKIKFLKAYNGDSILISFIENEILYDKHPIFLKDELENFKVKPPHLSYEIFMVPFMSVKDRFSYAESYDTKKLY